VECFTSAACCVLRVLALVYTGVCAASKDCCEVCNGGERANGGHLREMQDKTKSVHRVETLYKLAFSLKGLVLKYAVGNTFNVTKLL
jgi:hypothetical protein